MLRIFIYPIISLVLMILGNGLFSTFVSIRLDLAHAGQLMIGLVTASYYTGMLVGSMNSPSWIAKIGHVRAYIALSAATSVLILVHSLWIHPIFWAAVRFMSGLSMGALFVVIESWFMLVSPPAGRSVAFSIYLFVLYTALSAGQLLLQVIDPMSLIPYCVSGLLFSMSILPIAICSLPMPASADPKQARLPFLQMLRMSPRGFFGGLISGMLLASVYGLGPIYGRQAGLTIPDVATLMAIIICGGLTLQWPMGKCADRFSRRGVLVVACFGAALFSALVAIFDGASWASKLSLLWLFGGFSFVLYPLSMAFTCETMPENQIVNATGGFILSYGVGAIAGPLIAPLFMMWMGTGGLFYFNSSICLALGLVAIPRLKL